MYMAFVIHEKDEDLVSFYTKDNDGKHIIYNEYIHRGDTSSLNFYIKQYMFHNKKERTHYTNMYNEINTEKKALKKEYSQKSEQK